METFRKIMQEAKDHVDTLILHGAKMTATERQIRIQKYVDEKFSELP